VEETPVARSLTELQKALVFMVGLSLAIAVLVAAIEASRPPPVRPEGILSPDISIQTPSWAIDYRPSETANNTVFGLLMEAAQRMHFSVVYVVWQVPQGVFVSAINGTVNGADGLFWQYWVNGQIGPVAADHMALSDGANVLWNFTTPQAGA
jgi:Domain of unknown function (DUF4430)